MKSRVFIGLVAGFLVLGSGALSAAQGQAEAIARFKKGRALVEKRAYADALVELQASYAILPSANTLLLMAHAERELGNLKAAARLYEQTAREADAKVAEGEKRFSNTAADAREWLRKLAEKLGRVSVTVTHAPEGMVVTVGGEVAQGRRIGHDQLRLEDIWVDPGEVTVVARGEDGVERKATVSVLAGEQVSLELSLAVERVEPTESQELAPAPVQLTHEDLTGGGIPMGTWIAGGIGVAGIATFAIFGSSASGKFLELEACSPSCPESMRSVADDGKQAQTIANVGAVMGGLGMATAVGFYLFGRGEAREQAGEVRVIAGPRSVGFRGVF